MGTLVFVATHKKRIAITPALNISGVQLVQWPIVILWRNRYRVGKSAKFGTRFLLGARNKFRGGYDVKQQSMGA